MVTSFGGPSVLKWNQWSSVPKPGLNTALVRILICGVSGADNIMRTGGYTRFPQTSKPGFTPGYEITGVIEGFGEGEDRQGFEVGDRIASIVVVGGYGTHLVVSLDDMLKLDQKDDLIKATALPLNFMTAYGMLRRSAFPVDERTSAVLIGSAAGGVGTAVAQLLQLFYPKVRIFGTASAAKFEFLRSLGVIPIDRTVPLEKLPDVIKSLNRGRGVGIAYDALGSPESMQAFLSATEGQTGKLIAIGFIANIKPDGSGIEEQVFDPIGWYNERSQRASFFSVTNHFWKAQRQAFRQIFENELLAAVRSGELAPRITKTWRLDDVIKLHHNLATGKDIQGKNEIVVDQDIWERHASAYSG